MKSSEYTSKHHKPSTRISLSTSTDLPNVNHLEEFVTEQMIYNHRDSVAEWSKALRLGRNPKGRGSNVRTPPVSLLGLGILKALQ